MCRKCFLMSGGSALAVAALLLTTGSSPAAGLGQGQNLYQWSGGASSGTYSGAGGFAGTGYITGPTQSGYYGAPYTAPAAGYQSSYFAPPANAGYQSFYYAPAANAGSAMERSDRSVLISVRVPDKASISFDGEKTNQTGSFRQFISPPLQRGQNYSYHVRAHWMQDGKPVDQDRTITVHAGDHVNLNFGAQGQAAMPSRR